MVGRRMDHLQLCLVSPPRSSLLPHPLTGLCLAASSFRSLRRSCMSITIVRGHSLASSYQGSLILADLPKSGHVAAYYLLATTFYCIIWSVPYTPLPHLPVH